MLPQVILILLHNKNNKLKHTTKKVYQSQKKKREELRLSKCEQKQKMKERNYLIEIFFWIIQILNIYSEYVNYIPK